MHALETEFLGSEPALAAKTVVDLDRVSRWNVYRRLQELDLLCDCGCDRPLAVAIPTAAAALQLWSVVQSVTGPKATLVDHLDRCWHHKNLQ